MQIATNRGRRAPSASVSAAVNCFEPGPGICGRGVEAYFFLAVPDAVRIVCWASDRTHRRIASSLSTDARRASRRNPVGTEAECSREIS